LKIPLGASLMAFLVSAINPIVTKTVVEMIYIGKRERRPFHTSPGYCQEPDIRGTRACYLAQVLKLIPVFGHFPFPSNE
jgi:hypothetical protein